VAGSRSFGYGLKGCVHQIRPAWPMSVTSCVVGPPIPHHGHRSGCPVGLAARGIPTGRRDGGDGADTHCLGRISSVVSTRSPRGAGSASGHGRHREGLVSVPQLPALISEPADDVHAGAHRLKVDPVTRPGENKTSRRGPQVVPVPVTAATSPSISLAGPASNLLSIIPMKRSRSTAAHRRMTRRSGRSSPRSSTSWANA
jgi:hypothetical protein